MDETRDKKTFFILLYMFPNIVPDIYKKYTVISYKCVRLCISICLFVRLLKYLGLKCKWVEFVIRTTSRDERKKSEKCANPGRGNK